MLLYAPVNLQTVWTNGWGIGLKIRESELDSNIYISLTFQCTLIEITSKVTVLVYLCTPLNVPSITVKRVSADPQNDAKSNSTGPNIRYASCTNARNRTMKTTTNCMRFPAALASVDQSRDSRRLKRRSLRNLMVANVTIMPRKFE